MTRRKYIAGNRNLPRKTTPLYNDQKAGPQWCPFYGGSTVVPMHGVTPLNAEYSYSIKRNFNRLDFSQIVMNHYHVAITFSILTWHQSVIQARRLSKVTNCMTVYNYDN